MCVMEFSQYHKQQNIMIQEYEKPFNELKIPKSVQPHFHQSHTLKLL